jgi:ABC-2 type transport system permease protein
MIAIIRKELADYFNSIRCLVLFLLVFLASIATFYADQQIRGSGTTDFAFLQLFTTSGSVLPSLTTFLTLFFIPLIGIALGFDAINSERSGGTLSRLLSQPVYRDSVINGKFLAGIIILTIMVATTVLLVAGYGLMLFDLRPYGFHVIGIGLQPPGPEEIIRVFMFIVMAVIYGAFWMGLSILFSTTFRRVAASLLVVVVIWLFFGFFWGMIGQAIAGVVAPTAEGTDAVLIQNAVTQQMLMRFSPNYLFGEATIALLHPVLLETSMGIIGALASGQTAHMIANPLSLGQSLLLIWPHIVGIISLSVVCFAISYILFMKQEIRAT